MPGYGKKGKSAHFGKKTADEVIKKEKKKLVKQAMDKKDY
jgi:hypothetical protein